MSSDTQHEFEFLRSLPFGPYLPVDAPLRRLDPRTRILLVLLFITALLVTRHPLGLVLVVVVVLAAYRLARVPYTPLLRGWRSALPFLLFLALLQILFRAGGKDQPALFTLGPVIVSAADLWSAGALLLRFSGLMALIGLAAASLSESEITNGLNALLRPLDALRIPVTDFVMVIQITLRYFPLLAQTAERIAKAQASRGADWQPVGWNLVRRARQIAPLIVPLFVTSLRRAENMALAMDARGFGSHRTRTSLVRLQYRRIDAVVLALAFLIVLGIVFL